MTDDISAARSRIADQRRALERRVATLTGSFDDVVSAATDVATDDEHDPEGHTIAWERQQIAAHLDLAHSELAALVDAEMRLDDGTYGICVVCGRGIAAGRLDALPATSTCVSCAG